MKGISPVIATVLLLLMAVASVGGAWIWYQRQSAVVGGEAEESLSGQMEQQQGASISLAGIYEDNDYLHLIINNAGTSNVTLTGYSIAVGSASPTVNLDVSTVLEKQSSTTYNTTLTSCTSDSQAKIQLFVGGTSTQQFIETCP